MSHSLECKLRGHTPPVPWENCPIRAKPTKTSNNHLHVWPLARCRQRWEGIEHHLVTDDLHMCVDVLVHAVTELYGVEAWQNNCIAAAADDAEHFVRDGKLHCQRLPWAEV